MRLSLSAFSDTTIHHGREEYHPRSRTTELQPREELHTATAAHIQVKEGFKSQHLEVLRGTLGLQDSPEKAESVFEPSSKPLVGRARPAGVSFRIFP